MSDETIRPLLARVWSWLDKAGLAETREYIEYIAWLMIKSRQLQSFPELQSHRARIPYDVPSFGKDAIQGYLDQASARLGVLVGKEREDARLFDRYVLFYAPVPSKKGSYPIPRHLVDFMLNLLEMLPEERFADFACGSGGFLVNRTGVNNTNSQHPSYWNVGIETSPDWARIARANLALHALSSPATEVFEGDAFNICASQLKGIQFQCIAMTPAFGLPVDLALARQVLGQVNEQSSEILFTRLALEKLDVGGRSVIMIPGALLTNQRGQRLRQDLLEAGTIEAAIAFKKGMLQPFSDAEVAILLLRKRKESDFCLGYTWLLCAEYDGYPLNNGRDLLAPPSESMNDLPLLQTVLLSQEPFLPLDIHLDATGTKTRVCGLRWNSDASVIIFKVLENIFLVSLWYISSAGAPRYLLAQFLINGQIYDGVIALDPGVMQGKMFEHVIDINSWIDKIYGFSNVVPIPIFGKSEPGQMIAFASDGRWLGLTVTYAALHEQRDIFLAEEYRSQPEEFLIGERLLPIEREAKAEVILVQPEVNLGIQENRYEDKELPPRAILPQKNLLFDLFGSEQQVALAEIRDQCIIQTEGSDEKAYARYFRSEELLLFRKNEALVRQVLALLECMGCIVRVQVRAPGSAIPLLYYRWITQIDDPGWNDELIEGKQT